MAGILYGKRFLSTVELARFLNVSRVAVFKKIQKGEIKAHKIGRDLIILAVDLPTKMRVRGRGRFRTIILPHF